MEHLNLQESLSFVGEKLVFPPSPLTSTLSLTPPPLPHRIDAAQSCGALCRQEGVFRVNCMDCLDRTNVVESILSREVLQVAVSDHTPTCV